MNGPETESDLTIRYQIYQFFAEYCRAPLAEELAADLGLPAAEVRVALLRLHERHMIFVDAESGRIRMANPFSAVPTSYRVQAGSKSWWANCAWDTLGIAAALAIDVEIEAVHPLDGSQLSLRVAAGQVSNDDRLVYFPLPCRQWYDDLVYT